VICQKLNGNSGSGCTKSPKPKKQSSGSDLPVGIEEGAKEMSVLSTGDGCSLVELEINELNSAGEFYS
jgi:hypothetical protein